MAKKRQREIEKVAAAPPSRGEEGDEDEDSSDDDFDIVNVEFEWFNFDANVDFHGLKTLLRQLFDVDAPLFDVSALVDLILSQPTIGSTVKIDGMDKDPYAFITALNTHTHAEHPAMAQLVGYLAEKAETSDGLAATVPGLLRRGVAHVGLLVGERLINVPGEIAPPMYAMLAEEVEAAVEDGEPYEFSHYLVLSKTYLEVRSALDDEAEGERRSKKARGDLPISYFHAEDEILEKHALAFGSFSYTKEDDSVADSKRAFQEMGVKSRGCMILIEAAKLEEAIKAITEYLPPPK